MKVFHYIKYVVIFYYFLKCIILNLNCIVFRIHPLSVTKSHLVQERHTSMTRILYSARSQCGFPNVYPRSCVDRCSPMRVMAGPSRKPSFYYLNYISRVQKLNRDHERGDYEANHVLRGDIIEVILVVQLILFNEVGTQTMQVYKEKCYIFSSFCFKSISN